MKAMKTIGLAVLAMLLVLCLGMAALAEENTDNVPDTVTSVTPSEKAQEKADALNEALTAFEKARADSRKQACLEDLRKELDAYVAAGLLTQEQADLIYEYYVEQMTLNQDGMGFGRSSKGFGRDSKGRQSGQKNQGGNRNGFGRGGRQSRSDNTQTGPVSPAPSAGTEPVGT